MISSVVVRTAPASEGCQGRYSREGYDAVENPDSRSDLSDVRYLDNAGNDESVERAREEAIHGCEEHDRDEVRGEWPEHENRESGEECAWDEDVEFAKGIRDERRHEAAENPARVHH